MTPTQEPQDWNRTTAALRRLAQAIVRDLGDSEDIVQGAYLSALRRPQGTTTIGWLRSVVRSRAIDHRRRAARVGRQVPIDAHDGDVGALRPGRAPDEIAERLESQRELLLAVERLGDPYREVVYLRYFEDLGPTRIALRLGVPVKTIKSQLERGLQRLRTQCAGRDETFRAGLSALALGLPRAAPLTVAQGSIRTALLSALAMKVVAIAVAVVVTCLTTWMLISDRGERLDLDRQQVALSDGAGEDLGALASPETGTSGRTTARSPVHADPTDVDVQTASSAAPSSGTLRVHVLWSHGADAENVGVVAVGQATTRGVKRYLRVVTNAAGIATFEGLPAGETVLRVDRGAARDRRDWPEKPAIIAGETTAIELQLEKGVDVVGYVRAPDGAPIANAAIWLTVRSSGWTGGRVVARADRAGAFQLRDVPGDQSLGALVPNHAPSELIDLDTLDTSLGQVAVELTVSSKGGALEGRVDDVDGNPVPGTIVVIGDWTGHLDMRSNDTTKERWTPPNATTDGAGNYRLDALLPGEYTVRMRAPGRPVWTGAVTVRAEGTTRLDVALLPGATLAGRVSDAAGLPVTGARIRIFERPLDETFLISGQVDYDSPFAHTAATSDGTGAFLVEQVPSGKVWAYAQAPRRPRLRMEETVLYTKIELDLDPGEAAVWDPMLTRGRTIQGAVTHRDGTVMTGMFVHAREVEGSDSRAIYSGDGSFEFIQLVGATYDISVQIWDPPPGADRVEALGVAPDGDPLQLVAGFDAPVEHEPSSVIVRFEDTGQRATQISSVAVMLETTERSSWHYGEEVEGAWTFEVLKPGTFRPLAFDGDRVIAVGEEFRVEAGEIRDIGKLRSKRGGDVLIRLHHPGGGAKEKLSAILRHAAFRHTESFKIGLVDEVRLENIEPGPASLTFRGAHSVDAKVEFGVQSGRETIVTVDVIAAVPVPYKISWSSTDKPGSMSIRILDRADGSEIVAVDLKDAASYANPIERTFRAPVGEFTIVVEQGNGRTGRMDFDVMSLDPATVPAVEIDLR